jgi:hypothetical protein
LSTRIFETRSAKLVAAVAAVLLLAAFQVAVQAKPAHAWEVNLSIKGAGQITEVTDRGLVASECTPGGSQGLQSPNTTPTGTVGNSCLPGSPNGIYNSGDIVEYRATPLSGFTFVGWRNADGSGSFKPVLCDGSNNQPSYNGTNCRFQMFESLKAQAVFQDTTPPSQPSINNTTPTLTNQAVSFDFSTTSDPTFRQFECRVTPTVQTSFQPCSSGATFNPSANGTYTFEVRAVDWTGNISFPRSRSWTVDKTAPVTNITSAPSQFSNNNSAAFVFSSNEANTSFQCNLTGPGINTGFASCSSGKSYTGLSDGSHTFSVRATDAANNMSVTSRTWTIDTVAPDTTLDPNVGPAPNSTTQNNDPVFEFSSSDVGATFECNLTGPGMTSNTFTACPSPKSYTNLKDGTYTLKVRAKDQAGNVDASPEERTWIINSTPTVLEDSLTPVKAATGVSRTTMVIASFSEEMAPTSITNLTTHVSKTFKLQMYNNKKKKWVAIPARVDVSNNDTTATLDPYGATEGATEKPMGANKKFKATITRGVTDAQGNPIAKNFVWTFTTGR